MSYPRKVLLTLLVVGLLGGAAVVGTVSAFSGTTSNDGNSFSAGTVIIADNDAGSVLYNVSGQKPGQNTVKCIKLTYTGSLGADVKLYTPSSVNASAQYINLTVEKGTSDTAVFPDCGTFNSESTIYSGTLANFAATANSYANGIAAYPGSQTAWVQNDTLVYRFTLSVQDDPAAQGASSGLHSFTWEAQSQ
jgi:hypothetical protein